MRTFFIWFFGIIAAGSLGGMLANHLDPYGLGGLGGFFAGAAAFACFRLWAVPSRP